LPPTTIRYFDPQNGKWIAPPVPIDSDRPPLRNTHRNPWPDKTVTEWIKRHDAEFQALKQREGVIQSTLAELKTKLEKPGTPDPGLAKDIADLKAKIAAIKPVIGGVGIDNLAIDSNGHLVVKYTDGRTQDLGRVRGKDGDAGFQGPPGVVTIRYIDESTGKVTEKPDVKSGSVVVLKKRFVTKGK